MEFLPEEINAYAEQMTGAEPALLAELNRFTNVNMLMPRMISGHMQGRILSMFSHMIRPRRVLEIGTYTGYSALCWAEGLAEGGVVETIDVNDELETHIRSFLDRSEYKEQIKLYIGEALNILPEIEGPLDIVFIDADKENYVAYYDATIDKVRPGGFIIADNVLWSGKVTEDPEKMDEDTRGLYEYSRKIHADERVENVLFPVRDGLMIARKK